MFQDHTAAGKLNAVIRPTTPSGCQVSISRWFGRSDGIVRPSSWRESPTAKSQISIVSCTSPRASEGIFPASIVTSSATSALCSVSSAPRRLTRAPRTGAGMARHSLNAALAAAMAASTSACPAAGMSNNASPVIGERALTDGPAPGEERSTPQFSRLRRARERSSSVDETDSSGWRWVVVIGCSVSSGGVGDRLHDVVLQRKRERKQPAGSQGRWRLRAGGSSLSSATRYADLRSRAELLDAVSESSSTGSTRGPPTVTTARFAQSPRLRA